MGKIREVKEALEQTLITLWYKNLLRNLKVYLQTSKAEVNLVRAQRLLARDLIGKTSKFLFIIQNLRNFPLKEIRTLLNPVT